MIFGCINVFGTSGIISSDRLVRTLPQSVMNAEAHSIGTGALPQSASQAQKLDRVQCYAFRLLSGSAIRQPKPAPKVALGKTIWHCLGLTGPKPGALYSEFNAGGQPDRTGASVHDRFGSCVTSVAGPHGCAQL
jgi:hypothetical protein